MNSYVSGSLVRVTATFTDSNGDLANPTTVTLKYRSAAGSTTTETPTNDSTGVYHYDIDTSGFTGPGSEVWTYQFTGTGAVQAIAYDSFEVTSPAL